MAYASQTSQSRDTIQAQKRQPILFGNAESGPQAPSTVRVEVPAELTGQVVSATTQDVIYGAANKDGSASRTLVNYITEDESEYRFENGRLIGFGNYTDSYEGPRVVTDPAYVGAQEVAELVEDLVPDLSEFVFRNRDRAESRYTFYFLKNGGTVCEDQLIVRLNFDGMLSSVNVIRSGIDDPAEVDTDYFEAEVAAFLAKQTNTVEKYDIIYKKCSGVICAFCTVVFCDSAGGQYAETYTFL